MILNDLKMLRNHLGNIEIGIWGSSQTDGNMDQLLGDLEFAILDLHRVISAVQKEQSLREGNENLRNLYAEYTIVRDLIGSEK